MARKITTRATPEERREQAAALQATIADKVDAMRTDEQWRAFLDVARGFHRYSLNNLILIWSQRPDATRVAGFRQWQARGRQVRKGERAVRIFGYATKKITDDDTGDYEQTQTDENGQRVRVYYPLLSVFDIAQTEPVDPDAPDPADLVQHLTGADPLGIMDAVAEFLTARGWALAREPIRGAANGYTSIDGARRVVVDTDLAPAQAAKTALHEAAHVLLHADLPGRQYAEHRGVCETEAEFVAYVVAGLLGLDTSAYSIGYVAQWADADVDLIRSTASNVLRAAHTLADAITSDDQAAQVAA
jgi:antirestriction protein ArdC